MEVGKKPLNQRVTEKLPNNILWRKKVPRTERLEGNEGTRAKTRENSKK